MWAGYAFSKDFREERGHAYMLEDQMFTERQQVTKQPGTCINCHASVYVAYKQLGGDDIIKGFEQLNQKPYVEARKFVTHPVSCIDCHDSQTMQLRVTRPAFIEGMRAFKASQGIQNYDVNKQATRQEMRAFLSADSVTMSITLVGRKSGSSTLGQRAASRKHPRLLRRAKVQRLGAR